MPENMTYGEWYDKMVSEKGKGWVETERQKAYNESADRKQYEEYKNRLGKDVPADFKSFQALKYDTPDAWNDTKEFFAYKGRVPEASRDDFKVFEAIESTGVYGVIRVPPEAVDVSSLRFDAAHIALRRHPSTEADAKSFIENAVYSLNRTHWRDGPYVNFYSQKGAAYVHESGTIRTAFPRSQFKGKTAEVADILDKLGV